ncbi:hypothetical protein BOTBODRAFT_178877 [Botryobasidium botryosum FD-172 SS1]|uniref:DUF6535 domain-containing protein n=1 Tax=Botryobasidium botryosum (strain FD-172 SS1) TaxID=930990 RepID=A0A067MCN4_BOTB1|nr:hypothetical protein BOTBODRAFT_178877 [Botryobasidium botryosum FD-172 SS1]
MASRPLPYPSPALGDMERGTFGLPQMHERRPIGFSRIVDMVIDQCRQTRATSLADLAVQPALGTTVRRSLSFITADSGTSGTSFDFINSKRDDRARPPHGDVSEQLPRDSRGRGTAQTFFSSLRDETFVASPVASPHVHNTHAKADPTRNHKAARDDDVMWDGTGPESKIWHMYIEDATKFDAALIEGWNRTMDVLLIFSALFSAVLAAFIIESYKTLSPNSGDATLSVLQRIEEHLSRQSAPGQSNSPDSSQSGSNGFTPSASAIRINSVWFLSLTLSLSVAGVAVMAKQWLGNYNWSTVAGNTRDRSRLRQFRYTELQRWKVPEIIALLPTLLLLALALFFFGLIEFLFGINSVVAIINAALIAVIALFFVVTTVAPLLIPRCPYKTSLSDIFRPISMRIYYFLRMIGEGIAYWKARLVSRASESSWEQDSARVEKIGAAIHFSGSRLAIQQAEWGDILSCGTERIEARAFAWLIDSSPFYEHVQAAVRACAGLSAAAENIDILRSAGIAAVVDRQLFRFLAPTEHPLSDVDAATAGACARIVCLFDANTTPSFALASARSQSGDSSALGTLCGHPDGNVACYFNCAIIAAEGEEIGPTVQMRGWKLEALLIDRVKGSRPLGHRALTQLLGALNRITPKGFPINSRTINAAADLLSTTIQLPKDLRREIFIMLGLHYAREKTIRLLAPKSSLRVSELGKILLSRRHSIPEDTTIAIIDSIPGDSDDNDAGEGSDRVSEWFDDGICDRLVSLLRARKGEEPSDRLCGAAARAASRLGCKASYLQHLRNDGLDLSLAGTLSAGRAERTWIDVCLCLQRLSGKEERSYDKDLAAICAQRLKNVSSEDELTAVVSLMSLRESLYVIFMEETALPTFVQHLQSQKPMPEHILTPLMIIAEGVALRLDVTRPDATRIVTSGLLPGLSNCFPKCQEVFDSDTPRMLAWLDTWSGHAGRLSLIQGCRQGILDSGFIGALNEAWGEANRRMERDGFNSWLPPWTGDTDEERLDVLRDRAKESA